MDTKRWWLESKKHALLYCKGFPLVTWCLDSSKSPYIKHLDTCKYAKNQHIDRKKHIILLAIGANIGTAAAIQRRFLHLLNFFLGHVHCEVVATSPMFYNPPFGYAKQPSFYNACIVMRTTLNIVQIYGLIFYLERRFSRARKRAFRYAPRTLDIDIIFYDQLILKRPYFTIPHQNYQNRPSVLLPMLLCGAHLGTKRVAK